MFKFWKRKPKKIELHQIQKVPLKRIDYHPKVILAWAKAIAGNNELSLWLKENGFEELVVSVSAIWLKEDARTWLMKNGFAHLMAMINAAEGDQKAQKWLLQNDFEILYHIALAVEDEQESWKWLKLNATQDLFILAQEIKKIKDRIEENHNDMHSFGRD